MLDEIKNIRSTKKDIKNFALIFAFIFIIISGYFFFKSNELFKIFGMISFGFIFFGLFIPIVLKPIYWIWMIFAAILGWFMTRLILTILFYIVITPIGLIFKMSGSSLLKIKINKQVESYWIVRDEESEKVENLENQF